MSHVTDDLQRQETDRLMTAACERGAHDNCSGQVLFGVEEAERPEDVVRKPCECAHHGQKDAEFKRRLAHGLYPGRHTSRWAN